MDHIEELREYCLAKPFVTEDFPFDEHVLVFRVGQKIFALTSLREQEPRVNLKCEPEQAIILREEHPEVIIPGYHMNKKHWNTVYYTQIPKYLSQQLIDQSYQLVWDSLSKNKRKEIESR